MRRPTLSWLLGSSLSNVVQALGTAPPRRILSRLLVLLLSLTTLGLGALIASRPDTILAFVRFRSGSEHFQVMIHPRVPYTIDWALPDGTPSALIKDDHHRRWVVMLSKDQSPEMRPVRWALGAGYVVIAVCGNAEDLSQPGARVRPSPEAKPVSEHSLPRAPTAGVRP